MLIIRKNEVNNPIATVSMNKTLSNPYYLFSFQHIASKERVSFVPQVITSNCRYDKFRFTETFSTNLSVTPPEVHFPYLGQYYYSIYEQIGSGNTDPALAYNKLESGRAVVIVGNDTINECLFEPYISNDEEFSNVIYIGDDETICITNPITPTPTPTPLPCFEQGTGFDGQTDDIIINNGSFIIGSGPSNFTSYNGVSANNIIELNNDGTVYGSFNYGTGFNDNTSSMIKDSFGKYVIGGSFTTYNGTVVNRLVRLNTDGSIDNSLITGSGITGIVTSLEIQPDGKILAGGTITQYDGNTSLRYMIRITSGGTYDTTFNIGTGTTGGFNNTVSVIKHLDSGKILVSGLFTTFSSQTVNRIVRLNNDGSIDTTFNSGTGLNSSAQGMIIQPDNKIILVGLFSSYNGITSNRIVRLEEDGTIDSSFNTGSGFDGSIIGGIKLQDDGKILVGGSFSSYTGVYAGRIIRLENDGSIDSSFNSGLGFERVSGLTIVQKIDILSDGKIVCTGQLDSYNGTPVSNIAVLNPDGSLAECPAPSPTPTPTPTITPSQTCPITTQYLNSVVEGGDKIRLTLWDDSGYTISDTAICDYVVSGTMSGSSGTTYTGTRTFTTGDHQIQFNFSSFLQPGEVITYHSVTGVDTSLCICPVIVNYVYTPPS